MDAWEIKAREMFPDLREWVFLPERLHSIYGVLGELEGRCEEAHRVGDGLQLQKIYSFAEWCVDQEEFDVFNAAAVSFYEHLVDDPITLEAIPEWVRPDIFWGLSGLFEWRLGETGYTELKERYEERHGPMDET